MNCRCSVQNFGNGAVSVNPLSAYDDGRTVCSFHQLWALSRPAIALALVRDHPGCRLRSVVGAVAAKVLLVQGNSNVFVSLALSNWTGTIPDYGIIGTTSLGHVE